MTEPKTAKSFEEEAKRISEYLFDFEDTTGERIKKLSSYLHDVYTQGMNDQIIQ